MSWEGQEYEVQMLVWESMVAKFGDSGKCSLMVQGEDCNIKVLLSTANNSTFLPNLLSHFPNLDEQEKPQCNSRARNLKLLVAPESLGYIQILDMVSKLQNSCT